MTTTNSVDNYSHHPNDKEEECSQSVREEQQDDAHNVGEDEDDDESPVCNYCSFAVTGNQPKFQAIFICRSCFHAESEGQPLCICQACADFCHTTDSDTGHIHDVEYIGMGPCYCDCDHIGNCSIYTKSQIEAEKMGILPSTNSEQQQQHETMKVQGRTEGEEKESEEAGQIQGDIFKYDVYDISSFQEECDQAIPQLLVSHAQELIKYSKETFWIDNTLANNEELCLLEQFAWNIYQSHYKTYSSMLEEEGRSDGGRRGGAEWWVQVKDVDMDTTATAADESNNKDDSKSHDDETLTQNATKKKTGKVAIDLHYDKDEALAEAFGIGSFPTLSTVTYLTSTPSQISTLVFDHIYEQGEDDMIEEMLISRPAIGKHLVFDGKLLHGAPSHDLLSIRQQQHQQPTTESLSSSTTKGGEDTSSNTTRVRVTFLVNVWKDHRPASVQYLDDDIRQTLLNLSSTTNSENRKNKTVGGCSCPSFLTDPYSLLMRRPNDTIPTFHLNDESDLPTYLQCRIQLPFVTKGITWEDQLDLDNDDDDESEDDYDAGGLVVVTFPPPPPKSSGDDTMIVKFGPGLQAYLDYQQNEEKEDDDENSQVDLEGGKEVNNGNVHESGYV